MNNFSAKSKISYESESKRIYLKELCPADFPDIASNLKRLLNPADFTKLFVKVPATMSTAFICENYTIEAFIPGFFNGADDVFFMAYYLDKQRQHPEKTAINSFQKLLNNPVNNQIKPLNPNYSIRKLSSDDANEMVEVFVRVFESYPFPIFNADYLIKSMEEETTRYFGVWNNNNLIAISSAECSEKFKNAEMTDFAVLQEYRGQKLAIYLLDYMEKNLFSEGFKTFYTIARLHSLSMNKTFFNMGYKYCGTLHNNTQISGKIESMNIWYKNV